MKILVINPGSTSTKVSIFQDESQIAEKTLRHSNEELSAFGDIFSQLSFRTEIVKSFLAEQGIEISDLSAIAARGGPLTPSDGGTFLVDENLLLSTKTEYVTEHPSLLAVLIAHEIGKDFNVPAYMTDPVSVDEWHDIARFSGLPELPRISLSHALNMRAVARRTACDLNHKYDELNLIIVHLGGGISVSAHCRGRQIDSNNANEDGPFSPERTGTLPVSPLVKLCFSGKYQAGEMKDLLVRKGGMYAYLKTSNVSEVVSRMNSGDAECKKILSAMMYQVSKEIGKMAAVLHGKVDCISVTGGIAYNQELTVMLEEYCGFIAPFRIYPGEDEMEALALGALRILKGEEKAKIFRGKND